MKITKKKTVFKQKGLMKMTGTVTYTKVGDYKIPNLTVPTEEYQIVQIGLSLKSHDASQRANGFLTFFGGVIIAFAKDILDLIL